MRRKTRKGGGRQHELQVATLGGRGDGVAQLEDGTPAFIPGALPGETHIVREINRTAAGVQCDTLELKTPSPDRVEPPCPHYGLCGGCQLQHLSQPAYQSWKKQRAMDVVSRAGFDSKVVKDLVLARNTDLESRNRRRARFALYRSKTDIDYGFRGRASQRLEPISDCLVLEPEILELIEAMRPWLRQAVDFGESAQLNINVLNPKQKGAKPQADVVLIASKEPSARALQSAHVLHNLPDTLAIKLARVTWEYGRDYATPVLVLEDPVHAIEGIELKVPHDAFLQPSLEAESILTDLVLDTVPETGLKIADLFSGIGTFSIPLAIRKKAKVKAFEGFKYAIQALKQAKNAPLQSKALAHLECEQRDLERWALQPEILSEFDMLVLDPPRAGAKNLCQAIADSSVPYVTYVSCNPATFARDAKTLGDAGFELSSLTPVDQFPWTGHLELVAAFKRDTN